MISFKQAIIPWILMIYLTWQALWALDGFTTEFATMPQFNNCSYAHLVIGAPSLFDWINKPAYFFAIRHRSDRCWKDKQ